MVRQAWDSSAEVGGGEGLVGRDVQTSVAHIAEVLKAKALSLHREAALDMYEVYVAAMSEMSLRKRMSSRDPERLVLIVGDRHDIHQMAIDLKLRLIIITGDFPIAPELLTRAREQGTSVLQTPYDSATTVRRLKFSAPAELMIQEDVTTFGPEEKLSEVRDFMAGNPLDAFPVVDSDGNLIGVFNKNDFDRELSLKLILVDHNEMDQAVDGAGEVPIIEILDHHRLGSHSTQSPIVFINDIVGSTCTLVTEQYRRFGQTPPQALAGILMGGIITDTLLLRSPTATARDRIALDWLQTIAGVEPKALADEILSAGSIIATQPPRAVLNGDRKPYRTDKYTFAVAQVEEVGFENFFQHRGALLSEMKKVREEDDLNFFALLITNVVRETSMMLCVGEKRILDHLDYNRLDENTYDLPGVMSRKKQLLPHLLKLLS
jgi:manganese-dependent inorganic pyrophosphatase